MNEDGKIEDLVDSLSLSNVEWSAWEIDFIESLEGKKWRQLSDKQKDVVNNLWEAL